MFIRAGTGLGSRSFKPAPSKSRPLTRALVLLSGGLDSAVALWWTLREGHEPVALSFLYPGRPASEVRAARDLAATAGAPLVESSLPFLREPADAEVDPGSRLRKGPPRGYIPARNAVFYASAAYHAEILGCDTIIGGHNADDADRFPDATPGFFDELGRLLDAGLWRPPGTRGPRLVMPLARLDKAEVVALGRTLGVPLAMAWSCYEDGVAPCGTCPSCIERRAALPGHA